MKTLRGVLLFLVIVLVTIIAVGGSLIGFNHSGHQIANSQKTESTTPNKNSSESAKSPSTTDRNNGNQNYQGLIVVPQAQVPLQEYLKKMQEAMGMFKDATGLMANAPYMTGNMAPETNPQMNSGSSNIGMDKIHEGIYKMGQATTLMEQALTGMQKEVDKTNPINPYAFYGTPNINPYLLPYANQLAPNVNQGTPNVNQQNQNSAADNQGQKDQANADSQLRNQMNHGASGTGFNFGLQSVTYLLYGILVLSLFGIIVAVTGFIANLFKPSQVEEKWGESIVG